jgi:hypothetical protein
VDEGELAALLRSHAPRHSVPGAALGILHEGSVTTACYGVAGVTGAPVTPESRFRAAHVPELRGSPLG